MWVQWAMVYEGVGILISVVCLCLMCVSVCAQDGGISGVWLGGNPFAKMGGDDRQGQKRGLAGLMRVANFSIYGGYLANGEALLRAQSQSLSHLTAHSESLSDLRSNFESTATAVSDSTVVAGAAPQDLPREGEDGGGTGKALEVMRVVLEEPGAFSFKTFIDEAEELVCLCSLLCVSVCV